MNYKDQKTHARMTAFGLAVNETGTSNCPACGGHNKFTVTRTPEGVLWNCYRASCQVRGSTVERAALVAPTIKHTKLKTYRDPLHPLTEADFKFFDERFGLSMKRPVPVLRTEDERYALSVNDFRGYTSGWVIREPVWSGEPKCPRKGTGMLPKALTFMHIDRPTQSWYYGGDEYQHPAKLVLVEDQLSAMKVAQEGVTAVALLGTQLDARKVRELSAYHPSEVIIALDEDATEQAFKLAKKWGLAFPRVRVALLEQDIKDTDNDDVLEVLGI